ncbi:MAG: hypothetical protein WKF42_03075 [Solirubrobacteraceae bacterium]
MVRAIGARRVAPLGAVLLALVPALMAAGCGESDERPDGSRQRTEITVSAMIGPLRVSVSPARFGAGAIELLASNQTSTSRRLELRSRRLAAGATMLAQSTGPIPPGGTASLKADVSEGSYVVSAPGSGIQPTTLAVGAARERRLDSLLSSRER